MNLQFPCVIYKWNGATAFRDVFWNMHLKKDLGFPAGKLDNFLLFLNLFSVHRTPVLLVKELAKSKKEKSLSEIHRMYSFVFDAV